jgi:hypothetical protein
VAVLRSATGFELSPGTLDLSLVPGDGSATIPVARWTYPDGTGGRTRGEPYAQATAPSFWAAFGYAAVQGETAAPTLSGTAFPVDLAFSGLGGDVLLALPEAAGPAAGLGLEGKGAPGQGSFPSRLLAVRGELAYEYQLVKCRQPHATAANSAHYRLSAIRAATGETVTFAYGPNGVDFEAAWEAVKVRVTLAGTSADTAVPALDGVHSDLDSTTQSLACRGVEAQLQITYEGPETIPGYVITALVGPEAFAAEGVLAEGGHEALGRVPVNPDRFRHALQVSRIEGWPSGEAITFGYAKAFDVSRAGSTGTLGMAPTLLREIALPGRTLALGWEGRPQSRQGGESSGDETTGITWSFGVAALHDQDQSCHELEARGSSYRRVASGQTQGKSWIRQSRHFAFLRDPETGATCKTYVRDRWELGTPDPRVEAPEHRIPFDSEGDIPTFELDPQSAGLVPVPGQFTRWLNWKAGAGGLLQPPDLHGGRPRTGRIGLMGGQYRRGQPASAEKRFDGYNVNRELRRLENQEWDEYFRKANANRPSGHGPGGMTFRDRVLSELGPVPMPEMYGGHSAVRRLPDGSQEVTMVISNKPLLNGLGVGAGIGAGLASSGRDGQGQPGGPNGQSQPGGPNGQSRPGGLPSGPADGTGSRGPNAVGAMLQRQIEKQREFGQSLKNQLNRQLEQSERTVAQNRARVQQALQTAMRESETRQAAQRSFVADLHANTRMHQAHSQQMAAAMQGGGAARHYEVMGDGLRLEAAEHERGAAVAGRTASEALRRADAATRSAMEAERRAAEAERMAAEAERRAVEAERKAAGAERRVPRGPGSRSSVSSQRERDNAILGSPFNRSSCPAATAGPAEASPG